MEVEKIVEVVHVEKIVEVEKIVYVEVEKTVEKVVEVPAAPVEVIEDSQCVDTQYDDGSECQHE